MRTLKKYLIIVTIFLPLYTSAQVPDFPRTENPTMSISPYYTSKNPDIKIEKLDERGKKEKRKEEKTDSPSSDDTWHRIPSLLIGLSGGLSCHTLVFSDKGMDDYSHNPTTQAQFGLFLKIPMGSHWSIRPEVAYNTKSDLMIYEDISYKLKVQNVNLKLPISFGIPLGKHLFPYLMIAPNLDIVSKGSISYSDLNYPAGLAIDLSKANYTSTHAGLTIGGGLEWRISTKKSYVSVALEAGYRWGLTNTFSEEELQGATAADASNIINPFLGSHLWEGTRKWNGWEASLQIAIPIAHRPSSQTEPSTSVVQLQPISYSKDTIIIINRDTIYVISNTQNNAPSYQSKDCYSISEIHRFIDQGIDISDKRICLFNINFAFDSYYLSSEAEDRLLDLLILMRNYPEMTLTVFGHTDNRGTEEYNQRLSEYRANAVAAYLIENGVNPSRIMTYGMGKAFPISPCNTEECHMRNRRVEIEVNKIGRKYK